jgi:hypothetical protein
MHQQFLPSVRPSRLSCAAAVAAFACGAASASEGGAASYPELSFSGFGSIGVAHASIDTADFTSSILKRSGAGRSQRWSPHVDTRFGAQLDMVFSKRWSAVVQTVSEQRYTGGYTPDIEWANIKYQATPDLSLRFGRIALPVFLAADYRKIAYAYTLVRPPVEVYNAIPLSNSDGVDIHYRWNRGAFKNTTQAFAGRTSRTVGYDTRLKARGVAGLSHTTTYRATTLRASVLQADLSLNLARALFDGYRRFGAPGIRLAQRFDIDERRVYAFSAGLNYDPGNWFVMSELGRIKTSSYFGDTYTAYVSAGYRVGDITPYLSYAMVDPDSATSDPGLSTAGMAPAQAQVATALNGQLNRLLSTIPAQSTIALGARWDVLTGVALTLQYERMRTHSGSRGSLINVRSDFQPGQPVHVASAALDFVF